MGIALFVPGLPAPQGSKRHVGNGILVESSKALKPWREDIRLAFADVLGGEVMYPRDVATWVRLGFVFPRPVSTPRRWVFAVRKPDVDKLIRGVFDALTSAGVWADDKQAVAVTSTKRLAEPGEIPGCMIEVCRAASGNLFGEPELGWAA